MNLFLSTESANSTGRSKAFGRSEGELWFFLNNLSTKARILTVVLCIANIFSQLLIIVAENQISYLNKMKAIL